MSSFRARRRAAVAAVLLIGSAASALAHVIARPNTGAAGADTTIEFFVGHGCAGSPTVRLHVDLPREAIEAEPQAKAGWTLERIGDAIEWRGGRIDGHGQDSFFLKIRLPDTPGRTLYFPALQTCEKGEARWAEIPAESQDRKSLKEPAPFVTILPKP